ncbi:MAG: VCBS repeat-containing protein [Acidobacteria bacterium]|nr:VCBS repeat-containing protein [Acidobacteriota bacterium]
MPSSRHIPCTPLARLCLAGVIGSLFVSVSFTSSSTHHSTFPTKSNSLTNNFHVVSFKATQRGNPHFQFENGIEFIAPDESSAKSATTDLSPVSLATADFDSDGMPDVMAGYQTATGGMLVFYQGLAEAAFPGHRSQKSEPILASPLRETSLWISVPTRPDFLGAGDFNGDGKADIALARRGDTRLFWMAGTGKGQFAEASVRGLPGPLTTLTTGDINRADGLSDLVIGIATESGGQLLCFEGPEGALRAAPEGIELSAPPRSISIGEISGGPETDIVVAAGNELVLIQGRNRKLSISDDDVAPIHIDRRSFPFGLKSVVIGNFSGSEHPELALLADEGQVHLLRHPARDQLSDWELVQLGKPVTTAETLVRTRSSSLGHDDLITVGQPSSLQVLTCFSDDSSKNQRTPSALKAVQVDVPSTVGQPVLVLPMQLNGDGLNDLVVFHQNRKRPSIIQTQPMATFTVISTSDTGAGSGTSGDLRYCITQANASPGADTINFNIPGAGVQTITLTGPLPVITQPVTIDGYTQSGTSPNTLVAGNDATLLVEIDGTGVGVNQRALELGTGSSSSRIRGLVMNRTAALSATALGIRSDTNTIDGNFFGVNPTGTTDQANHFSLQIFSGSGTLIGGTTPQARNLLSGATNANVFVNNSSNLAIQGNYIGPNAAGTADLTPAAFSNGVFCFNSSLLVFGGTSPGAGNLASGSRISLYLANAVPNATIQGNIFGLNAAGTAVIPTFAGIQVENSADALVGGTTSAARNILSGSDIGVGIVDATTNAIIQGNYIGTNPAGDMALGNVTGIGTSRSTSGHVIGGTATGARNVISGNTIHGIYLDESTNITIQNNLIGVAANGTSPLGNEVGIDIGSAFGFGPVSNTLLGGTNPNEGNVIAFSNRQGVFVANTGTGNRILGNRITGNGRLGIDLANEDLTLNDALDPDTGANNVQNYPTISPVSASSVNATLDSSTSNTAYPVRLEFFANEACDQFGAGEGDEFLGSTSLAAPGTVLFTFTPVAGKDIITATATDANGNTSEFSICNRALNITAAPATVTEGSPASNMVIANVTDPNQAVFTLNVTINGGASATSNGVMISNLVIDEAGAVHADVVADCDATDTTFTLSVTNNVSQIDTDTLAVTVTPNPPPTLSYASPQSVLLGGPETIFPSTGPLDNGTISSIDLLSIVPNTFTGTILVDDGTGVVSVTNAGPLGSYVVTIRATDNCGDTTDTSFTLDVVCMVMVTASNTGPYCEGGTIQLNCTPNGGTAPYSFVWSGPGGFSSTDQNPTRPATVANAGLYSVTVTDSNNCSSTAATTTVVVNPLPTVSASNTGPYCEGGTIQLNATPGVGTAPFTFSWTGPGGFTSSVQNPTRPATTANAGLYSVTITDANNCTSSAAATTTVVVNPLPTVSAGNTGPYCDGTTIQLNSTPSGNGPVTFSWTGPNGFTSSDQNPTRPATAANAGLYSVTVTDSNNCVSSPAATTTVVVNPLPTVSASNTGPYCEGVGTIQLNATPSGNGPFTFSWTGPNSFISSDQNPTLAATAANAGLYSVTVTDANTCASSTAATTTVVVNPLPTVSASNTGPYCDGTTIQLNSTPSGNGPFTFSWTGPNGFTASDQNPTRPATAANAGLYSVMVTDSNSCVSSTAATTTVVVNPLPTVSASNTGPYCEGVGVIQLQATPTGNGPFTFSWTGPNSFVSSLQNPTLAATMANAGMYSVTVTDSNNCSSSVPATTLVVVNPLPTVSASNTGPFCEGTTIQLNSTPSGNGPFSFSWTGPNGFTSTLQNPTLAALLTNAGVYNVTVTDSNTCVSVTASTTVTVNPATTITLDPVSDTVNSGETATFTVTATGTGTITFQWFYDSDCDGPNSAIALNNGDRDGRVTITSDAGSTTLTLTNVMFSEQGCYFVQAVSDCGTDTSASATLQVLATELSLLYVADTSNNRVQKFDATTWSIIGAGTTGTGPGQFRLPEAVTADITGQRIYVADTGNNRIHYSTDGGITWANLAIAGSGLSQVRAPQGLTLDVLGNLYVADTGNNRVLRFNGGVPGPAVVVAPSGTTIGKVTGPRGLAIDTSFNLFIADTMNNRIQKLANASGSPTASIVATVGSGLSPGHVRVPEGVAVDNLGNLFVADTGNNRVLFFAGGAPGPATLLCDTGSPLGQVRLPEGLTISQGILLGGAAGTSALIIGDSANNRIQGSLNPTTPISFGLVGAPLGGVGSGVGQFRSPSKIR